MTLLLGSGYLRCEFNVQIVSRYAQRVLQVALVRVKQRFACNVLVFHDLDILGESDLSGPLQHLLVGPFLYALNGLALDCKIVVLPRKHLHNVPLVELIVLLRDDRPAVHAADALEVLQVGLVDVVIRRDEQRHALSHTRTDDLRIFEAHNPLVSGIFLVVARQQISHVLGQDTHVLLVTLRNLIIAAALVVRVLVHTVPPH